MRPMTLPERGVTKVSVSLGDLTGLILQWAAAYAAASATTAIYEKLRDAASPGDAEQQARKTG